MMYVYIMYIYIHVCVCQNERAVSFDELEPYPTGWGVDLRGKNAESLGLKLLECPPSIYQPYMKFHLTD